MEEVGSSETLAEHYHTTWRHIAEDLHVLNSGRFRLLQKLFKNSEASLSGVV
jgi:hypothetical protein